MVNLTGDKNNFKFCNYSVICLKFLYFEEKSVICPRRLGGGDISVIFLTMTNSQK